jgi:hypothetical protein
MKKKLFLLVAAIFLFTFTHAQGTWVNYKIDDKISVKLPSEPQQIQEGTTMTKDKDSVIYLTILVDFVKVAKIDSAGLAPYLATQQFADGLKTGMLSKMPGSTMDDVKIGKWKNYYSYTIEGGNAEKKLKLYTYMVIIGSKMYGLMCIVPVGIGPANKDNFFSSLAIN